MKRDEYSVEYDKLMETRNEQVQLQFSDNPEKCDKELLRQCRLRLEEIEAIREIVHILEPEIKSILDDAELMGYCAGYMDIATVRQYEKFIRKKACEIAEKFVARGWVGEALHMKGRGR